MAQASGNHSLASYKTFIKEIWSVFAIYVSLQKHVRN